MHSLALRLGQFANEASDLLILVGLGHAPQLPCACAGVRVRIGDPADGLLPLADGY